MQFDRQRIVGQQKNAISAICRACFCRNLQSQQKTVWQAA
jgi:hypothetical protein